MQALLWGAAFFALCEASFATERVTLTLRDIELQEAMAMLAKQQRLNILLSEDVEATLSLNLYDVKVEEAIEAIANAAGYAVEYRNGAYFVIEHDQVGLYSNGNLTQVRGFSLHYANPETLEEMLEPYLSSYGKINAIPERKLLFVTDQPEFLNRISRIVHHADAKPQQVVIEAQILEISLNEEDSFGINWVKLFDSEGGSGVFGNQGFAGAGTSGSSGFFFDFTNPNIDLVLTALEQDGRVRTLSTPKLIAIDNQEAEVIIGDRRGYTVTTTINQVTSQSIEFLESGVILRVTPHVDDKKHILLNIHPEVSTGTVDTAGIPSQTTTEVTTSLLVPNGETVFIGGLMKHTVSQAYKRVPVLGKVPVVKRLFSSRERTQVNTETIVLITPRLVEDGAVGWSTDEIDAVERVRQSLEEDAETLTEHMDVEAESPDILADFEWKSPSREPTQTVKADPFTPEIPVPTEVDAKSAAAEPVEIQAPSTTSETTPETKTTASTGLDRTPAKGWFVVQTMTMSDRNLLDAYLEEVGAPDLEIVRIERDGNVLHAPVLGPFETLEQAKVATQGLPKQMRDNSPWVRKLSSLQAAMRRASAVSAQLASASN
jgi:type II secretory pathway component GspD/PulD (secretin)